jgi:hypothetical protein
MKKIITISVLLFVGLWVLVGMLLTKTYYPDWIPQSIRSLTFPSSTADLGQSFSILDGLLSSIAIILGLIAIILQGKQQTDANVIGAYSARMQFLLSDNERLQTDISNLIASAKYDKNLLENMSAKKSRQLLEASEIDKKIKKLLENL